MEHAIQLRERCIQLALATPDIRPNAVHIVAAVYERFILHGDASRIAPIAATAGIGSDVSAA